MLVSIYVLLLCATLLSNSHILCILLPATLKWSAQSHQLLVCINYGANENFLCMALADKDGLPVTELSSPLSARALSACLKSPRPGVFKGEHSLEWLPRPNLSLFMAVEPGFFFIVKEDVSL